MILDFAGLDVSYLVNTLTVISQLSQLGVLQSLFPSVGCPHALHIFLGCDNNDDKTRLANPAYKPGTLVILIQHNAVPPSDTVTFRVSKT